MACLSSARRLIIGATSRPLATVLLTLVASSDAVQLRNVDGGQSYHSQFSNSLPSDPSYFPIGVWFESVVSQADVNLDKDAGPNLYVVLTANSNLSLIQRNGMRAILQESDWRSNQAAINSPALAGSSPSVRALAARRMSPAQRRSRCQVSVTARPRSLARIGRFPSQMVDSRTDLEMAMRPIFTGLIINETASAPFNS
jgi:hypothetical protein